MKNWQKILTIFVIIIGYVFIINIFANLISFSHEQSQIKETIIGGTMVEISVSDSVSVQVIRKPHWYGRRIVNDGKEHLSLFYFINLPWKIKGYNFLVFHLLFSAILVLFTILIFIKKRTQEESSESSTILPELYYINENKLKGGNKKMKTWAKILIIAIVSFFGLVFNEAGFTLLVLLVYLEFFFKPKKLNTSYP